MTVKRVAVDLRMVGSIPHGVARYALGIWNGLPARDDIHFTAFCAPEASGDIATIRPGDLIVRARQSFLSPLEQLELPWLLRQSGIDLLHATSFSLPALSAIPLVLTLHDATHLSLPEHARLGARLYHRLVVGPAARRAVRVLTVSEFSATEVGRHYGMARDRIDVAPDAIDLVNATVPRLPDAVSSDRPYLLYVGNGKPHKNVEVLIAARSLLADPPPLVLCGEDLERFARPGIVCLGPVTDDELVALYQHATLFLFPSRMEGFGLPPLEAADWGTPVLVANTSALREIWKNTAPLLSPDDPASWADSILRLLANDAARATLATRCRALAASYRSWDRAVDAALSAYKLGLRLDR
jgi:glycosyltransferase involved in cell wall biosynthesis